MVRSVPGKLQVPVVEPMLATAARTPPTGSGWGAEVKWDGIRCVTGASGRMVRLTGRHGSDLSVRFPEITAELVGLALRDCVLDGEIVQFDDQGRPSFALLQQRIHLTQAAAVERLARTRPATLLVFDVLHLGEPTLDLPYSRRRELLATLRLEGPRVRVPPAWTDATEEALAWTAEHGLEGIVLKRLTSAYRPGARSPDWIKIKHIRTLDVVIGGWIPGGPGQALVKSLVCGIPDSSGPGLVYVGNVGTGFSQAERRALAQALRSLRIDVSPFTTPVPAPHGGDVVFWVRPTLAGEVQYLEWTPQHRLRHPVWRGLRGAGEG